MGTIISILISLRLLVLVIVIILQFKRAPKNYIINGLWLIIFIISIESLLNFL